MMILDTQWITGWVKLRNNMEEMIKQLKSVKNEGHAQSVAVDYQHWAREQDLSYAELGIFQCLLEAIGEKFNLTEEFRENGII